MAFLILMAWSFIPSVSLALSARDLVIVFNRNLPESQAVASYHAKRKVPPENLVGVDVSSSEDMTRKDYNWKLVPPVKAMVERLKAQGHDPGHPADIRYSFKGGRRLHLPNPKWSSGPWQTPRSKRIKSRRCDHQ